MTTREAEGVSRASTPRRVLATSPFILTEAPIRSTKGFFVGDRVTHDRCGMGRIIAVDESFVTVRFGDGEVRKVPAGARGFQRL